VTLLLQVSDIHISKFEKQHGGQQGSLSSRAQDLMLLAEQLLSRWGCQQDEGRGKRAGWARVTCRVRGWVRAMGVHPMHVDWDVHVRPLVKHEWWQHWSTQRLCLQPGDSLTMLS
jgi:hypothetical protein